MAESAFRSIICSCLVSLYMCNGIAGEQIRTDCDGLRRIVQIVHKSILSVVGADLYHFFILLVGHRNRLHYLFGICHSCGTATIILLLYNRQPFFP